MSEELIAPNPAEISLRELPFVSACAAIELDDILLGRPTDTSSVGVLAAFLREAAESGDNGGTVLGLINPSTATIFSSAITASSHTSVRSLEELASEAIKIAEELDETSPSSSEKLGIEKLRAFCSHLARSAVANEHALLERHSAPSEWRR